MPEFFEILHHAAIDTASLILPLFLVYFLIEYLEKYRQSAFLTRLSRKNSLSSFWGALFGLIPQCGFSGIAAELYSHRFITAGTLFAVFIATGDEALPVLFSNLSRGPSVAASIALLLAVKFVSAFLTGAVFDLVLRKIKAKKSFHDGKCEHYHNAEKCSEEADCGNRHGECGCHHEGHEKGFFHGILLPAVKHTLKIILFIFALNFLFSGVMHFFGKEEISAFLTKYSALSPLFASLFGLIPNCAVSVALTELYLDGVLSFAAVAAGLSSGAGVGLFVLFKSNKRPRENLLIALFLFLSGAAVGYAVYGLSFLI